MMLLHSGNRFGWTRVSVHFGLRNEPYAPSPVRTIHNRALLTDNDCTRINVLFIRLKLRRTRNYFDAAVPVQCHWTTLAFGRKLVGDDLTLGKRVTLRLEIVIFDLRLDSGGRSKVECPEHRIDHMASPITDCPVAEGNPSAP